MLAKTSASAIKTSLRWTTGNSLLGAIALVIAVLALGRTVNALTLNKPVTTDLVVRSTPTDIQVYDPELVKRFPWFAIGWAYGVVQGALLIYGLSNACKDFSKATSSKIACISGAIGTAVTIAGAGLAGWKKYLELGGAFISAVKKRDEYLLARRSEIAGQLEETFTNLTGLSSQFIGHKHVVRVLKVGTTTKKTVLYLPTVRFTTPHNESYNFAIEQTGERQFTSVLGLRVHSSTLKTKREDFDKEDFSNGGLEFTHNYVAKEDGDNGVLNKNNDWQTVYDQTYCLVNKNIVKNHNNNNIKYQIYDHKNEGTIASGAMVAYSDQPGGMHGVNEEPSGLSEDTDCEAN